MALHNLAQAVLLSASADFVGAASGRVAGAATAEWPQTATSTWNWSDTTNWSGGVMPATSGDPTQFQRRRTS